MILNILVECNIVILTVTETHSVTCATDALFHTCWRVVALQAQVAELQEQLSRARQAEDANRAAVRSLEETLAGHERQRLQQQAHEVRVRGHRQAGVLLVIEHTF